MYYNLSGHYISCFCVTNDDTFVVDYYPKLRLAFVMRRAIVTPLRLIAILA